MHEVSEVRAHVDALLSTYLRDRQEMTSAMNTSLGEARRARTEACCGLSDNTKRMMRSFHRARMHVAREQRTWLAADRDSRSQAVVALLDKFRELRIDNAQQMDQTLKNFVHENQAKVSGLIKRAHTSHRKIEKDARNLVAGFSGARHTMAKQQEDSLASGVQERHQAVEHLLDTYSAAHGKLHKEKAAVLDVSEMSHDQQLKEIFKIIRRHPDGISAAQIGEGIGLSALQVGRLATELAESGKVRKDETTRRYFP